MVRVQHVKPKPKPKPKPKAGRRRNAGELGQFADSMADDDEDDNDNGNGNGNTTTESSLQLLGTKGVLALWILTGASLSDYALQRTISSLHCSPLLRCHSSSALGSRPCRPMLQSHIS